MKKYLLIVLSVIMFSLSANAQQGTHDDILKIFYDNGWSLGTDKYCDLLQGENAQFYYTFEAGGTYCVFVYSSDNNVTDADLSVYDSDGSLYKQDITSKSTASCYLSPYDTRTMHIYFKNARSSYPYTNHNIKCMVFYK